MRFHEHLKLFSVIFDGGHTRTVVTYVGCSSCKILSIHKGFVRPILNKQIKGRVNTVSIMILQLSHIVSNKRFRKYLMENIW